MEQEEDNQENANLEESHYDYAEEEKLEENDIYAEMSRESLVDEDEISSEEAAFMQGYDEAV